MSTSVYTYQWRPGTRSSSLGLGWGLTGAAIWPGAVEGSGSPFAVGGWHSRERFPANSRLLRVRA
jgi:hypothetical protein